MFSNVLSCCIRAACIYALLLFSTSSPTWAQSVPEVNDIIKSLAPRANQVAPGRPIDGSSEGRKTPGRPIATQRIVIKERTYVIDMVRQLDLEVFFDYGSDKITSKARPVLDRLGAALVSETWIGGFGLVLTLWRRRRGAGHQQRKPRKLRTPRGSIAPAPAPRQWRCQTGASLA